MKNLSPIEIRALYGFASNQEAVVFGARVVNKPTQVVKHRVPTLDDYGTKEYNEYHDRKNKLRETPATPEIRSQVTEIL
jgi:hypothetical protein